MLLASISLPVGYAVLAVGATSAVPAVIAIAATRHGTCQGRRRRRPPQVQAAAGAGAAIPRETELFGALESPYGSNVRDATVLAGGNLVLLGLPDGHEVRARR
jgi:hypothetical protein